MSAAIFGLQFLMSGIKTRSVDGACLQVASVCLFGLLGKSFGAALMFAASLAATARVLTCCWLAEVVQPCTCCCITLAVVPCTTEYVCQNE